MPDTWITPRVWVAGEKYTASKANDISNNFRSLFPYTAGGDLAYRDPAGAYLSALAAPAGLSLMQHNGSVPSWLAKGLAYHVLRVNAAANGFEFADPRLLTTIVSRSANGAVSGAIPWDVESRDDDGWHDNATNNSRITVKAAGVYMPGYTIGMWMPTGGAVVNNDIDLLVNGVSARLNRKACFQEGTMVTFECSPVSLVLSANDYVEVATIASKTIAGGSGGQHSFFSLVKVG